MLKRHWHLSLSILNPCEFLWVPIQSYVPRLSAALVFVRPLEKTFRWFSGIEAESFPSAPSTQRQHGRTEAFRVVSWYQDGSITTWWVETPRGHKNRFWQSKRPSVPYSWRCTYGLPRLSRPSQLPMERFLHCEPQRQTQRPRWSHQPSFHWTRARVKSLPVINLVISTYRGNITPFGLRPHAHIVLLRD